MSKSPKKYIPPESHVNPPSDAERDYVIFYSRLTHTLENACGRDILADRLAELRHTAATDREYAASPAIGRTFRRLGLIAASDDVGTFTREFARTVGEAVTRSDKHVLLLLELFVLGDAALDLKPVCGATPQCQMCLLTRECDYYSNPRKPEMAALTPSFRLLSGNEHMLSDAELMAVILFGERATGMEPIIGTLLARYGRLRALFRAEVLEYGGIRGVSKSQSLRLAAVAALHRRLLAERRREPLRICSAQDIYDRYAPELRDLRTEAVILIMLDQQNNVIRDAWFCEGSPNVSHMGIADLLRPAVREYAIRVALVHNHPSNNPAPSLSDLDFTRRLRSACDIMGLGLVDHVIVAESGYFSFAEEGMLGG